MKRWLVGIALVALLAVLMTDVPRRVYAQPPQQGTFTSGAVVALAGTPHLWVADERGVLHWGGDTRGLSGHFVDWGNRSQITLDQLKGLSRGDPWLSAGLVKIGDPIYLAKWETTQASPTLLHIQSIADVELFGINGGNYGDIVLEMAAWEQRFGMSTDGLPRGVLAPLTALSPTPTLVATSTPQLKMAARVVEVKRTGEINYETMTTIEISNAVARTRLTVSAITDEWECAPDCMSSHRGGWGPIEAGTTDASGRLTWTDKHGPYKSYHYTFQDPAGNQVGIDVGDDLKI